MDYVRMALAGIVLQMMAGSAMAQPTIELSAQQIKRLGVTVEPARVASHAALAVVPARVAPARAASRTLATPFAGVVSTVEALPGDKVEKGEALLTVISRDYLAAISEQGRAKAEYRAAKSALGRQQKLVAEGIESGASLEAAETRAIAAETMLVEHRRALENTAPAGEGVYAMLAPTSGYVEQMTVSSGDAVEAMASVGLIIVEPDRWLQAQLPADLVGAVAAGDFVELPGGARGVILAASSSVDPKTRSGVLFAEAPADAKLKIGQMTQLTILRATDRESLLQIPSTAIIRVGEHDVVFRKVDAGGFQAVSVRVESKTAATATFEGDIAPGDLLAVSGLAELKAIALEEAS